MNRGTVQNIANPGVPALAFTISEETIYNGQAFSAA
jgi:hypothetical protein